MVWSCEGPSRSGRKDRRYKVLPVPATHSMNGLDLIIVTSAISLVLFPQVLRWPAAPELSRSAVEQRFVELSCT